MKNRYQIEAKAGAEIVELIIYGSIGPDFFAEESNDAKSIIKELDQYNDKRVHARISSHGGSLADGLAIYNRLERHPGGVDTFIDGVAFSAASLIAMAGRTITMAGNAILMIHAPMADAGGNAKQHRQAADVLDKFAESIVANYARAGGPRPSQVREWLADGEDHYFSAQEAYDLGLIDEIDQNLQVAAAQTHISLFNTPAIGTQKRAISMTTKDKAADESGTGTDATFMQGHKKAVMAGDERGRRAENERLREIDAAFDGLVDENDETDPMLALRAQCRRELDCTLHKANIRILSALKEQQADPISNPINSAQSPTGGVYRQSNPQSINHATIGADAVDKFIMGGTKAISIRAGIERDQEKIREENGSEFISMSLLEMAKYSLRLAGVSPTGSADQIVRRVINMSGPGQGSDHFAAILENIANKSVMAGYSEAEETWNSWTQPGVLSDYRTASRVNKSLFDKLDKMEEYEKFKHGRFADVKQSITGYLHGKAFSLTLQAIVNDDLGMLGDDARAWGEAANVTIGDAVFLALTLAGTGGYGQSMDEDSTILFHADHNNYIASGSGGAPSDATISAGRTAMMGQLDPNGRQVASMPRYLLHGTGLTTGVYTLLNSQHNITGAASTLGELNAVKSLGITGVEEYRFDTFVATAWILAALRRTVEVAFVGGQSSPTVERMPAGEIPGIGWQISIPFGVSALDFRSMFFNYGA